MYKARNRRLRQRQRRRQLRETTLPHQLLLLALLVVASFDVVVSGFQPQSRRCPPPPAATGELCEPRRRNAALSGSKSDVDEAGCSSSSSSNRRRFLLRGTTGALLSGFAFVGSRGPPQAWAVDGLDGAVFKSNPLTNPVLEKIRIWEQAEADELKYGGELERGDAGNRGKVGSYPALLVPILEIASDLRSVREAVRHRDRWEEARRTLGLNSRYDKTEFKKIFNRFGDNIYYSDPDRANMYLAGGATPSNEQSLAYLLRNQVLSSVDDLKAELSYLLDHPDDAGDVDDLYRYADEADAAMRRYLDIIPPEQLRKANELMMANTNGAIAEAK